MENIELYFDDVNDIQSKSDDVINNEFYHRFVFFVPLLQASKIITRRYTSTPRFYIYIFSTETIYIA